MIGFQIGWKVHIAHYTQSLFVPLSLSLTTVSSFLFYLTTVLSLSSSCSLFSSTVFSTTVPGFSSIMISLITQHGRDYVSPASPLTNHRRRQLSSRHYHHCHDNDSVAGSPLDHLQRSHPWGTSDPTFVLFMCLIFFFDWRFKKPEIKELICAYVYEEILHQYDNIMKKIVRDTLNLSKIDFVLNLKPNCDDFFLCFWFCLNLWIWLKKNLDRYYCFRCIASHVFYCWYIVLLGSLSILLRASNSYGDWERRVKLRVKIIKRH